jgi:hypothetical protein
MIYHGYIILKIIQIIIPIPCSINLVPSQKKMTGSGITGKSSEKVDASIQPRKKSSTRWAKNVHKKMILWISFQQKMTGLSKHWNTEIHQAKNIFFLERTEQGLIINYWD